MSSAAGDGPALRAAAVQSPALHPVFVGHDRRSQVHRPRRRRHARPAPQGAPAPLRHPAWRPGLLLHDLRLDDVELAGVGAGLRRDAGALRRLAVPSRRQRALRSRRRDRHDALRHVAEVHRRGGQGGPRRRSTSHSLATVRTITSTGSPLAPESFDFVYGTIKRDVHLASISGGTDIVGLFAGGNPNGAVWRGEIQARALGMKVEVFDEAGRSVREREGRARLHDAVSVDAGRLLERPRRPQVSRGVLRAVSRRLAPRRLRRADRHTTA